MKSSDLRHMGRRDLLRLLLEVQQENESLRQENETLRAAAEEKLLELQSLGSIAEAAMKLNHVFEDAQRAADQYVANAKAMFAPGEDEQKPKEDEPDAEE